MSRVFEYETTVRPDWIDYNGHLQDAYYGLIFSHAIDAFQDAVGFDAAYRARTGCTIYLVEDHKFFLSEVKVSAVVAVQTRVIGRRGHRFHLWSALKTEGRVSAVSEMLEMHVAQHPQPRGAPIPDEIAARIDAACLDAEAVAALRPRARQMSVDGGRP